jgi:hypothetical protein
MSLPGVQSLLKDNGLPQNVVVGAFHNATGAIESVLKYVSPDAHWIARHLVTAGGKRIKMRLLGTVVTVFLETSDTEDVSRVFLLGPAWKLPSVLQF